MSRYVLGADVEFDLEQIWDYIAEDNIDAADRWIEKLFSAFELLGRTPGIGHMREDLTDLPVLFWPVETYLIVYRVQKRAYSDRRGYTGRARRSCISFGASA